MGIDCEIFSEGKSWGEAQKSEKKKKRTGGCLPWFHADFFGKKVYLARKTAAFI